MYPAECLEDEETSVLNEIINTGNKEEVIHEHLKTICKSVKKLVSHATN